MKGRISRRLAFLALAAAASVAVALVARPAGGAGMVVTYGVNLSLAVVQATKVGRDTFDVDPKIPADLKSALIKEYKTKYMKYTSIRSETVFLAWRHSDPDNKREGPTSETQFTMPDGKTLVVKYIGWRKNTSGLLVNFQFQIGSGFSLVDIWNNTFYFMKATDDPNPILFVFSPSLVQVAK